MAAVAARGERSLVGADEGVSLQAEMRPALKTVRHSRRCMIVSFRSRRLLSRVLPALVGTRAGPLPTKRTSFGVAQGNARARACVSRTHWRRAAYDVRMSSEKC